MNGCDSALKHVGYPVNNLTYLRSIDANTFVNNVQCGGCVDGLITTQKPSETLLTDNYTLNAAEAVIIGWTSTDGLAQQYGGYAPTSEEEYKKSIAHYFPNKTQQDLMENVYYPPSKFIPETKTNEYQMAWYTIICDACLGCSSLLFASQIAESKKTDNVYVFEFGGPTDKKGSNYAPHASELAFVFDWDKDDTWSGVPWSQSLSNSMVSAWTNYGIYGVPNVTNEIDDIDIIWKAFRNDDGQNMMVFNDTGKIISSLEYQNGACEFLNYNTGFSLADICKDIGIK